MVEKNGKFVCLQCGRCCNENLLTDETSQAEKEAETKLTEKNPYFVPNEVKPGPFLHDFEKKEIEEALKSKGIEAKIAPETALFDCKTRTWIAINWKIIGQPCPCLKDKKCLIYNERPLQCRYWPLIPIERGFNIESHCSALNKEFGLSLCEDKKRAAKFFWKQLIYLNKDRFTTEGEADIIRRLQSLGIIQLSVGCTKEEIQKIYGSQKTLGLLAFLDENKLADSQKLIKGWKENCSKKVMEKKLKEKYATL